MMVHNGATVNWDGKRQGVSALPQFPSEDDVADLGIEDRVRLLAQAVTTFREEMCTLFVNVSPDDLLAGEETAVGSISPFTGLEFQNYRLIEPATYREGLRQLALDVSRLRVIKAQSATGQVTITDDSFSSDPSDDDPPAWQPPQIGFSQDATSSESTSDYPVDFIEVSASYSEATVGEPARIEKSLSWTLTQHQVTGITVDLPECWSDGSVAVLARVEWSPWTGDAPEDSNDGVYSVVGASSGEAISVTSQAPDIEVGGSWSPKSGGSSYFIPAGFALAKSGDEKIGLDWTLVSYYDNTTVYRRNYMCLLIPTFTKGLDESAAANALAKLRSVTPPPAVDGRALPRPEPGMIFGINLGPGLDDGTSSGWLAVVPSLSQRWYNYEAYFPCGLASGFASPQVPLSWTGARFDCVSELRFIGAEADFQVVYENSRNPLVRKWDLPVCGLGEDVFLPCGWRNSYAFLTAWDAPRIRQIVGKHLVADVTVTDGFSQVVKIYRRNGGVFTRTPGVAVNTSELTLLRTLTIGNPSNLTGLGSGPEHLKISDDTGTNLDISLAGISNYRGDWEFKLARNSDSQILWREFWKSNHTTNDITAGQNYLPTNYTVSLTRDRSTVGTLTGLPGPCHVWPETPASFAASNVSATWTTTATGRTTQVSGEPNLVEAWQPLSGFGSDTPGGCPRIPVRIERGLWKAEFSLSEENVLKTEFSLDSQRWGTMWEQWTSNGTSGESVTTYTAPDGLVTDKGSHAADWTRIDFGGLDGATGTLPWEVRRVVSRDNSGTLVTLNPAGGGALETITESGGFSDGSVSAVGRGTRVTSSRDSAGYPVSASEEVFSGSTAVETGSEALSQSNKTGWGAPTSVTYSPSGLRESWSYASDHLNLASWTSALGATGTLASPDYLDRPKTVTFNGVTATRSFYGLNSKTAFAGTDITGTTRSSTTCDALGRLLTSKTTWNGLIDNLTVTHGTDSLGVTRVHGLLGTHQSSIHQNDGSLASSSGPTLAFGGIDGSSLTVDGGLLKSTASLAGAESSSQTTWTDAWGRVRRTAVAGTNGGSDVTEFTYSDPSSTLKSVATVDAAGRRMVEEREPWAEGGGVVRVGIKMGGTGALGASDRYVESVTSVDDSNDLSKIVTTLLLNEDDGNDGNHLREILRTETDPSNNHVVTTVNGGEETITRTYSYSTPQNQPPVAAVSIESSKGWSRTTTLGNLGQPGHTALSGTGIPSADISPSWRADGSLAGVSLSVAGAAQSVTFNSDGTLSSLTDPLLGSILGGHTIANGTEIMTVNGTTTQQSLDGTSSSLQGPNVMAQTRATVVDGGNGFAETIAPGTGASTIRKYNAVGAKTGHNYASGPAISTTWLAGGLLDQQTLGRGGSISVRYSADGAKDLTSIQWPAVSSSGLGEFYSTAASFTYYRNGQVKTIGDASGSRTLGYEIGRLATTIYNAGPLNTYQITRSHDGLGRLNGITLTRNGQVIHAIGIDHTADSDEVYRVSAGNFSASLGRDGTRNLTSVTRAFTTQYWNRGTAGRITSAGSDVSGAPSFDYASFDSQGRRHDCTTGGGTWTYTYGTAGQLALAHHTLWGDFTYACDGIGRRANNTGSALNQYLNQANTLPKNLLVSAEFRTQVTVTVNGVDSVYPDFSGSANFTLPAPGSQGAWVPWHVLAVLTGQGEGTLGANPIYSPLANPDAKAEQSGAVWNPPASESFTYDADGNRESSSLWNYGWDGRNKLVRSATRNCKNNTVPQGYDITYDYDAEGRRFKKNVDFYQNGSVVSQDRVTFVWDGWDLIYERHQLPSGLTTLERKYVWGPDIANGNAGGAGGLYLIRETRGTTTTDLYPLYDGSGHVVALADDTGALQASYTYGPFGELIKSSGPFAQSNPWRYATKYFDVETGLYDFGLRYYDPVSGQWLSREPLGEDESLNLYAYCHNDPVNRIDIQGQEERVIAGSAPLFVEDSQNANYVYMAFPLEEDGLFKPYRENGKVAIVPIKLEKSRINTYAPDIASVNRMREIAELVTDRRHRAAVEFYVGNGIEFAGGVGEMAIAAAAAPESAGVSTVLFVHGYDTAYTRLRRHSCGPGSDIQSTTSRTLQLIPGIDRNTAQFGDNLLGCVSVGGAMYFIGRAPLVYAPRLITSAANNGGRAAVTIGEDLSSAAGTRVWRNVPAGHGALADAQAGIVRPYGSTINEALDVRALGHDMGSTQGSGLTSWTADQAWALARQKRLGGVVLETSAPNGSVWFNQAAKGAESQVLIPGIIKVR